MKSTTLDVVTDCQVGQTGALKWKNETRNSKWDYRSKHFFSSHNNTEPQYAELASEIHEPHKTTPTSRIYCD